MLWFEGNIVTDWKKAPHLAQMLFRVCKTNLEGVPNDPITYSWCHVLILEANLMDSMCKGQMILLSALFSGARLITVVIIKISFADWDTAGICVVFKRPLNTSKESLRSNVWITKLIFHLNVKLA